MARLLCVPAVGLVLLILAAGASADLSVGDCVFDLESTGSALMGFEASASITETYTNDKGKDKKAKITLAAKSVNDDSRGTISGNVPVRLATGSTCSFPATSVSPSDPSFKDLTQALAGLTVGTTGHEHFRIDVEDFEVEVSKGKPDSDTKDFITATVGVSGLSFDLEFSGPSSLDVNSAGTYKVKPSIAGGTFEASGSYRKAGYEGSIDQSIELAEGGADGLVAASTTKCSLKVSSDVTLTCTNFAISFNKITIGDAASTKLTLTLALKASGKLEFKSPVSEATTVSELML